MSTKQSRYDWYALLRNVMFPRARTHARRRITPHSGGIDELPMVAETSPRQRLRRGGPRTPIPLVGLIAICAGIGIAYVNQVAHATQATYEASNLNADQAGLRAQAAQLDAELNRLRATERIVAAAQTLGMRPPAHWAYVASAPVAVLPPAHAATASTSTPGDPMQGLIATIGGALGVHSGSTTP